MILIYDDLKGKTQSDLELRINYEKNLYIDTILYLFFLLSMRLSAETLRLREIDYIASRESRMYHIAINAILRSIYFPCLVVIIYKFRYLLTCARARLG